MDNNCNNFISDKLEMFVRNELDKIELSYHVTTYADKELFINEQDNRAVVVIHIVNNHNVYLHTECIRSLYFAYTPISDYFLFPNIECQTDMYSRVFHRVDEITHSVVKKHYRQHI